MKKKGLLAMIAAMSLTFATAIPAFAGTWEQQNNGDWKYYNDNGSTATGWVDYNGSWYYLDASGSMKTGWVKDEGSWYFLYDSGIMAADTWIDNYYVNSSGKWTKTR